MRALVASILAVSAVGCVSSGDVELLHREITDVSRQVENLGRQSSGKEDLQAVAKKMADQNSQVLKSNADIQVELKSLRDQIQSLRASLDATSQRLDAVSQELAGTREQQAAPLTSAPGQAAGAAAAGAAAGAAAATAAAQPVKGNEPTQLYNAAYEDYLRGSFDMAIQGFREYIKRYPSTDLTDNAMYWVGESQYSKKQYKEAVDTFTDLLNTYKTSDKAAAALLKKGLAYLELGDRSQAVINLQYVLYEHPGTEEADLAKKKLTSLGVKVK
jgi:tol-pal system protein YbgF